MYKRFLSYQKLHLLLNTLETLNIYEYKKLKQFNKSTHNFIYNKTTAIHNINTIQLIYLIYKTVTKKYLQEIIINILYGYTKDYLSITTSQYLKRYIYIYKKNQGYYHINNHYCNFNIEEIAITNLYMMNQVNNKGISLLIYYLYE